MNWNGCLLVIGFASGRNPQLPVNLALLKGYQLVGVFWGNFTMKEPEANAENNRELIQFFIDGKINPLVSTAFPLAESAEALFSLFQKLTVPDLSKTGHPYQWTNYIASILHSFHTR